MTDELTDAQIDAMLAKYANGLTGARCAKASDEAAKDVPLLVAALRSKRTQTAELRADRVYAEERLAEVRSELRAELERERTQNREGLEALKDVLPFVGISAYSSMTDSEHVRYVAAEERARAALSIQVQPTEGAS